MLGIRVRLEAVNAKKFSTPESLDQEVNFKVNVSLSETARTPGDVTLEFVLEMTSQPNVARIVISGSAVMEGTKQEIQQMLVSEDPKRAPPVLNKIYERVYGTVYLLCDAMMVPHPLPNLLRV